MDRELPVRKWSLWECRNLHGIMEWLGLEATLKMISFHTLKPFHSPLLQPGLELLQGWGSHKLCLLWRWGKINLDLPSSGSSWSITLPWVCLKALGCFQKSRIFQITKILDKGSLSYLCRQLLWLVKQDKKKKKKINPLGIILPVILEQESHKQFCSWLIRKPTQTETPVCWKSFPGDPSSLLTENWEGNPLKRQGVGGRKSII